jgi:hypothetical protein
MKALHSELEDWLGEAMEDRKSTPLIWVSFLSFEMVAFREGTLEHV